MQYTLRNVPKAIDRALRRRAREAKKSLNEVAIDALAEAVGLGAGPARRFRDLSSIAGTWEADPPADVALADQRKIEPALWR